MIWFTSDLHIGHDKDFIWKARGFNSIEEHDKGILKNWNAAVDYEDTVYILGDLCLGGNEKEWDSILCNLHGNKYFILGNHDTDSKVGRYESKYNIYNLGYANMYRYNKKRNFYLSHYPTLIDNYNKTKNQLLVNLCGHKHTRNKFSDMDKGLIYHVELDAHNCMPVSIETIIKDIEHFISLDKNVQLNLSKNNI